QRTRARKDVRRTDGTLAPVSEPSVPRVDPDAAFERLVLDDGAWIDIARGWIADSDEVFRTVLEATPWHQGRIYRYDHWVDEPRLGAAGLPGPRAPHPVLTEAHRALQQRYGVTFRGFGLARYRDERD